MGVIRPGIEALEDSPILEVFREGFHLPGILPMWAGEFDVPTPHFICEAASQAMFAGRTFYSDNRGIPALRQALIDYHRRLWGVEIADQRIAFTYSGMNAVMQVAQATVEPGANCVAITPSWPNVMRAMQINGAEVREVAMHQSDEGWSLRLEDVFAACDARTRIIYLATPGNPTGWQITEAEARHLLDFCRERGTAILADEVYHRLVYDREVAFSFLQIARPEDPVFVVNSFSKSWAMTGWRMGWLTFPAGCTETFEKLLQFNTSGGLEFMQAAAIAALTEGEPTVAILRDHARRGRDIVNDRLARMPRVRNIPNNASFYALFEVDGMADTMNFCKRAVREERIGMAPNGWCGCATQNNRRG